MRWVQPRQQRNEQVRDVLRAAQIDIERLDRLLEEDEATLENFLRELRPPFVERSPAHQTEDTKRLARPSGLPICNRNSATVYAATLLASDQANLEGNAGQRGNPWIVPFDPSQVKIKEIVMLKNMCALLVCGASLVFSVACNDNKPEEPPYNPVIDPASFVNKIDNPFFPLRPGTTFIYNGQKDNGAEINHAFVSHETKDLLGVTCVEVKDSVWVNNELIEDTFDWHAQDKDGNVWYFGEASRDYENGNLVSTEGSWEAGVEGAQPGIILEAHPKSGDSYRQDFLKGVAEDEAEVLGTNESLTVPFGSFVNCLKTRESTQLEPDFAENKYYAAGVGNLLTVMVKGGNDRSELVAIKIE